jgi:hypothetical protein
VLRRAYAPRIADYTIAGLTERRSCGEAELSLSTCSLTAITVGADDIRWIAAGQTIRIAIWQSATAVEVKPTARVQRARCVTIVERAIDTFSKNRIAHGSRSTIKCGTSVYAGEVTRDARELVVAHARTDGITRTFVAILTNR